MCNACSAVRTIIKDVAVSDTNETGHLCRVIGLSGPLHIHFSLGVASIVDLIEGEFGKFPRRAWRPNTALCTQFNLDMMVSRRTV